MSDPLVWLRKKRDSRRALRVMLLDVAKVLKVYTRAASPPVVLLLLSAVTKTVVDEVPGVGLPRPSTRIQPAGRGDRTQRVTLVPAGHRLRNGRSTVLKREALDGGAVGCHFLETEKGVHHLNVPRIGL